MYGRVRNELLTQGPYLPPELILKSLFLPLMSTVLLLNLSKNTACCLLYIELKLIEVNSESEPDWLLIMKSNQPEIQKVSLNN